jgi:hypothetical protein
MTAGAQISEIVAATLSLGAALISTRRTGTAETPRCLQETAGARPSFLATIRLPQTPQSPALLSILHDLNMGEPVSSQLYLDAAFPQFTSLLLRTSANRMPPC